MARQTAAIRASLWLALFAAGWTFAAPPDPALFEDPPKRYRPWTVWWWFGNAANEADLAWELEQMDLAGIGGVEINPVYSLTADDETRGIRNVPLYSNEWRLRFAAVLREAERRGMTVVLRGGSGWPFGGPWVEEKDASRAVARGVTEVNGPGDVDLEVPKPEKYGEWTPEALELVVAWERKSGATTVLPAPANGRLRWRAPAGQWQISAVWRMRTGQRVSRAGPGGEGLVIDHFSARGIEAQLRPLGQLAAALASKAWAGIASDSLELDDSNWTPGILEEFKRRKGYDLAPLLPHLWERIGPRTEGIRQDFFEVLSALQLENYFAPLTAWARARGMKSFVQAHGGISDALQAYGAVDVPEGETIWPGKEKHEVNVRNRRLASSAAHLYGKPVVSAETYTWLRMPRFLVTLDVMKAASDAVYLDGINHIKNHGYSSSPRALGKPGQVFYASTLINHNQTWWPHYPALAKYVARMNYLMQCGTTVADVAVYAGLPGARATADAPKAAWLGEDDAWHEPAKHPGLDTSARIAMQLHDAAQALQRAGYGFDIVNDEALARLLRVQGGTLTGGLSRRYRALLFIGAKSVPVAVMRQAAAFARAGGMVIGVGRLPAESVGYLNREAQSKEVAALAQRHVTPVTDIAEAVRLLDARIGPDFKSEGAGFSAIHRVSADAGWYFIANPEREERSAEITLRDARPPMQLWDPMTGERRVFHGGELTLGPWGSAVIVYGSGVPALPPGPAPARSFARSVELAGPWWFKTDGTIYYAAEWRELRNWLDVPDLRSFAGIGSYQTSFEAPQTRNGRICLGRVEQSAEVLLNGASAGVAFLPPYCVDVTGRLRNGRNMLEVRVANLWGNWIAAQPVRPSAIPGRGYGLTEVLYGPSERSPLPGGLLGPVTLRFD